MFRGPRHPSIPAGDNPAGRTRSRRPNLNDSIGRRRFASVQPEMERDGNSLPGGRADLGATGGLRQPMRLPILISSVAAAGFGPSSVLVARTPPQSGHSQDVREVF